MNSIELIRQALNLPQCWKIVSMEFEGKESQRKSLHISICYTGQNKFTSENGNEYSIYDSIDRTFRHLNFFQHKCYIHCKVPESEKPITKLRRFKFPGLSNPPDLFLYK